MSLIEKAVQRLGQLKQAGGQPATAPHIEPMIEGLQAETATQPGVSAKSAQTALRNEPVIDGASVHSGAGGRGTPAPLHNEPRERIQRGAAGGRMVELDLVRLTQAGMVTPDLPRSAIAEEYRVIKRPLIRNAQGRGAGAIDNANLIMITSSLPGEGKSFTAINLAMSIAMEMDHTVLLVDADFPRPSVLTRLGLPPQKGLMDVLAGDVSDLSEVMLRTNIDKLSILPAGMPHQRATEMIASDAMNRMLDQMANRYSERIIIFDSPPLLPTTEARVLAAHMGQVVVVVESNRTTHGVIRHALSTIEACPVKLLVLNKASEKTRENIYGYGQGYGYGYADTRTREAAA